MILESKDEIARYPFVVESVRYIKSRGIDLSQLDDPSYQNIVEHAFERVKEAIEKGIVHPEWRPHDNEVEILSYPVAMVIVAAVGNPYLKGRYALAEAKRVRVLLGKELRAHPGFRERILKICKENFAWDIRPLTGEEFRETRYDFAISLSDYLRNSHAVLGERWKLVNRVVIGGFVYLSGEEVVRLLQEEVRRRIEGKLGVSLKVRLPKALMQKVNDVRELLIERGKVGKAERKIEGVVMEVAPEAFPPCVRGLYNSLMAKQHLPHIGRFTLATFLLNVGASIEDVLGLFRSSTDFSEKRARYQLEHLKGKRGSRRRYLPPNCRTLRTYGVCNPTDPLCKSVKNPLVFYKRRMYGGVRGS